MSSKETKKIAHENALCEAGKKEYDSIVMVIFIEPLCDSLRSKLINHGYRVEDLWYNVCCPYCKSNVSKKRQGEWHCPVCIKILEK